MRVWTKASLICSTKVELDGVKALKFPPSEPRGCLYNCQKSLNPLNWTYEARIEASSEGMF